MLQGMEADNATEVRPGLRDRKKQKTRETIIEVALELFVERGYEDTTIAEIADAATIADLKGRHMGTDNLAALFDTAPPLAA